MGLSINSTKFLMYAKTQGVCFARTATIGRQGLHLSAAALRKNLSDFGYSLTRHEVDDLLRMAGGFAEPFIGMLGAAEINSFDASEFEGASDVHDLNFPIDEGFKNRFTAVVDSGTLEHIFNFPVAIKNCMEMVAVGGHFLGVAPTNNFMGHGFYQFSPELFFRIFSEPNGFKIARMIICEDRPGAKWFEVTDSDVLEERVMLVNTRPASLMVIAEKVRSVQIFTAPPQQSDYVRLWESSDTGTWPKVSRESSLFNRQHTRERLLMRAVRRLYDLAPTPVKTLYRRVRNRRHSPSLSNSRFFRRIRIT